MFYICLEAYLFFLVLFQGSGRDSEERDIRRKTEGELKIFGSGGLEMERNREWRKSYRRRRNRME